ncbi:choline-binding transcriptional repressor BetI [Jiella marina]|uniref:choline-binding transcriptional repressor BetI n=1 Tax=Jiella sp. LLJ827 TaxID=2917712 RepID=UPI00210149FD|nr:transcriptional regulator BetI [Jiella sp. LLJ827]MCQ0988015.1 transcriptional regulator BetI [Jiella sp. LLJ827]
MIEGVHSGRTRWDRSRSTIEARRRQSVIAATVAAIDQAGSLDVTMAEIARLAGVSPALVHHYFGTKDDLMIAAMRTLLGQYRQEIARRLREAPGPRERVSAVISGSFAPSQFTQESISAWLVFYLYARRSAEAARLLRIYFRRLETNLVSALDPLVGAKKSRRIAAGAGAMIDGVWLRQALTPLTQPNPETAARMVERFIDAEIQA